METDLCPYCNGTEPGNIGQLDCPYCGGTNQVPIVVALETVIGAMSAPKEGVEEKAYPTR